MSEPIADDFTMRPASWRRYVTAMLAGTVPIYTYIIWSHLSRGGVFTLNELLFYPLVIGGGWCLLLLVLYRNYCGKPVRQLNRRVGAWWKDGMMGVGIAAGSLVLLMIQQRTLSQFFPQKPPPQAVLNLIVGLSRDPLMLALWIGPVVWIGVALFEELQRVFLLDLWWELSGKEYTKWLGITTSAILFALAHIYQGPANMIGIFVLSMLYGLFYLKIGRLWPLIIAHGLYDSFQIVMAVIQIRQAGLRGGG